jgi:AcrR family transcriptional regulator
MAKETRDKILEAGMKVFASNGYRGTTTRDICRLAKVNGAAINYHFGSKESLWLAVCKYTHGKLLEISLRCADFSLPVKDALERFIDQVIDEFVVYPYPLKILTWMAIQAEFLDFDQTTRTFNPTALMLTKHLKEMQEGGAFDSEVDLEVTLPLLYGQFLFLFNHHAGHRFLFGKDITDKDHATRVKKALTRIAILTLGVK